MKITNSIYVCCSLYIWMQLVDFSSAKMCDLRPRGAVGESKDAENRFRISIVNSSEKYNPGETYNVILHGKSSFIEESNNFNGFVLTVETLSSDEAVNAAVIPGTFKLLPNEKSTKIDEFCPNTVVHNSFTSVNSVEVQWVAPSRGAGCVRFRATVLEKHIWYKDSNGLTLKFCELEAFEDSDIAMRCGTCNDAKYELRFEGLWTRQTHPRFYPDNSWLIRFSDVIGASHTFDYRFWKFNETPSSGLIEFSEKENITLLESEIKSNKTRTVIKAKGISYPNITGTTFAAFRVDSEHHLLSLIALIKPSPDWFVGVSGLPLCGDDGNWVSERKVDLYPYDLGVWDDVKYEVRTISTQLSNQTIQKIDHSAIPESPFYTSNEDRLKPLARLHLTKTREYDKSCSQSDGGSYNTESNNNFGKSFDDRQTDDSITKSSNTNKQSSTNVPSLNTEQDELILDKECEDTPFGVYDGECSIPQCDVDRVRILYRQFNDRIREHCISINTKTEKLQSCSRSCTNGAEIVPRALLVKCSVSEWQDSFTPCDVNRCTRNRTRYINDVTKKKDLDCLNISTVQEIKCLAQECLSNSSSNKIYNRAEKVSHDNEQTESPYVDHDSPLSIILTYNYDANILCQNNKNNTDGIDVNDNNSIFTMGVNNNTSLPNINIHKNSTSNVNSSE